MNRAPLITAIVLLLLPVLYVGSYLALVVPAGFLRLPTSAPPGGPPSNLMALITHPVDHYRWGGMRASWFFYPLEQVDRKVRPGAWDDSP